MTEDPTFNKPLSREDVARRHPARPALRETDLPVTFRPMLVPSKPGIRVFLPPVDGTVLERPDRAAVSEVLRDASGRIGARLENLSADQLAEVSRAIAERLAQVSRTEAKGTEGFLPDHLPFKPVLPELEEGRRVRPFIGPRVGMQLGKLQPGEFQATTIFSPNQRYLFDDTSFPWCTTGRVDLTGGWGSGTLVGPRHLLCASHMMTWNPDNTSFQRIRTACLPLQEVRHCAMWALPAPYSANGILGPGAPPSSSQGDPVLAYQVTLANARWPRPT
jgi:hypothetical protein